MRTLVDLIVLATLLTVGAGVFVHRAAVSRENAAIDDVRNDVRRIERELRVKAATGEVEVNGRGWPIDVDPDWFGDDTPANRLLSLDRPWLEIAPPEHAELEHPVLRIAFDGSLAAFWYNPAKGVVRARVPLTVSDRRAAEIYNRVNGTALSSIFEGVTRPDRRPTLAELEEYAEALAPVEDDPVPDDPQNPE